MKYKQDPKIENGEVVNITNITYDIFPNIKLNLNICDVINNFFSGDTGALVKIVFACSFVIAAFVAMSIYGSEKGQQMQFDHELRLRGCIQNGK